ncbi:PAN2-PAN3 deadenylation complex subunit PAN3 isoform X4 [Contarinia nasturtii]|uniref:PAN2-PAN3 deadenylation complex subunit PAN3 isoform X4 n=1 Tax=Contarinia nasturtii TaxID=265458 RepID=UPI0012D4B5EF|nr:PAN2-PAN3 deadenylation complex subunit PAN3 isoform X4 [Contarinia nasturtii]
MIQSCMRVNVNNCCKHIYLNIRRAIWILKAHKFRKQIQIRVIKLKSIARIEVISRPTKFAVYSKRNHTHQINQPNNKTGIKKSQSVNKLSSSSYPQTNRAAPQIDTQKWVTPQSPEFIPSKVNSSPNFYSPYASVMNANNITPVKSSTGASSAYAIAPSKASRNLMRVESPHSVESPKLTPSPPSNVPQNIHQENVGGTTYFYPTGNHSANQTSSSIVTDSSLSLSHHSSSQNISYSQAVHVYPGPSSNVVNMQPRTQLSSAIFIPDDMRNDILARNEIANLVDTIPNPGNIINLCTIFVFIFKSIVSDIPNEIDNYHSLFLLETLAIHQKLPLPSSTYKATHVSTGIRYCLRRLHGFRLQSTKCMGIVDLWKKFQHSNVVQLREVFTTKSFGDQSLVLVYDYHPGSQTLLAKYFTPTSDSNNYQDPFQGEARPFSHKSNMQRTPNGPYLPETEIWAIIMQLTAGLRAIHQAGFACRTIDPTKIIVTGKRVRFSFVGISDIIYFDPNQTNPAAAIANYQQEDLTSLGKLVLALACRCLHSVQEDRIQSSVSLVSRNYSSDLRNLVLYLLTTTTNRRSVTDLMPMIGARFYTQLDALQCQCDRQEDELAKEMENGRLYRLLVKLGCINERPELNMDVTWSETGDRYMLKLFRDFLFHAVNEDGTPWLDHAHIIQCLNKLDAGTLEKVQLVSRDEQSILIVTYAELKHCLEQAFSELTTNAVALP